ncbi:MAG: family 43 glycosylhydrolase [Bacteroidota bacterium]
MRYLLLSFIFLLLTPLAIAQKSSATLRLEAYDRNNNCTVDVPDFPDWQIAFDRSNLRGDLAPNVTYTRRDPSSVLRVNGKYYVWYSYSLTDGAGKTAPWDLNDLYYASSEDGYVWEEHGPAIERGPAGTYDHRSAFTTEVFHHEGLFYLVYQAAADLDGVYGRNTIAMAYASSPHGPWTKLAEPILTPTYTNAPVFDNNAVHDPCLLFFRDKFYLYYKGESSQTPICGIGVWGLNKQVKWGVAIADQPTGPFVKSDYNPITNTGHEVCVWKSGEGIAIMLYQDGPEYGTLQYADDGLNFEIRSEVQDFVLTDYSSDFPEAAGLYRPVGEDISPVSGVSWGLCHVLTRDQGKYWMYLKRFENEDASVIVDDADNAGIVVEETVNTTLAAPNSFRVYPNPVVTEMYIEGIPEGMYTLEIIALTGQRLRNINYHTADSPVKLPDLPTGVYILRLYNEVGHYHQVFVKGEE